MTRTLRAAPIVLVLLLAGCTRAFAPSQLTVQLVPASETAAAHVRVTGLSSDELRALRSAAWDPADWQRLLFVSVGATRAVPVAGRYVVTARTLEFQPAFPFDPGRDYLVRLDLSRLPTPRAGEPVSRTVSLPARDHGPAVEVTAVFPSGDVWPENLLRFYVHFSGPMARRDGVEYVRLIDDETAEPVPDALLQSPVDFWSPDQRRYTVFLDPGRVKTDLVPNQELGRALVAARRYTVEIDARWPDAAGRPLRETYRRTFLAGDAVEAPLALADWQVDVPVAGSQDPLVLTLPRALDRALLERTLGVVLNEGPIDGRVDVAKQETEWRFFPAAPWPAAAHELVVLSELEDPQGNRIDQAFEVNPISESAPRPERYTIPFAPRKR